MEFQWRVKIHFLSGCEVHYVGFWCMWGSRTEVSMLRFRGFFRRSEVS